MIPCAFSETQFSFCFTFEYIRIFYPSGPIPLFPNTVEEGREGGGYDVEINGNIFLQFKIPKFYDKPCNITLQKRKVFNQAYYQINIDTDKKQFQLLKELCIKNNRVLYVSPEFYKKESLKENYKMKKIVKKSAMFSVYNFPEYKSGFHELIYTDSSKYGKLFSEPFKIYKEREIIGRIQKVSLYEQAVRLSEILKKYDINITKDDQNKQKIIDSVYITLLSRFNILWLYYIK